MVKRALLVLATGAAVVLLGFVVVWAREARETEPSISVQDCVDYATECAGLELDTLEPVGPQADVIEAAAPPVAAEPCKAWLAGSQTGISVLSKCLRSARRIDSEMIEQIRWEQRTASAQH